MLNAPRPALPIGVRAVETMTASCMVLPLALKSKLRAARSRRFAGCGQGCEPFALGGEPGKERRRPEPIVLRVARMVRKPIADLREAHAVGVVHRPTAVDWPAIAIDPDHVDVAWPGCDPLLQDA